ncbi:hypothetical protein [Mesorhizobium sp. M1B.F.Ca.ET.045.04.1.1]|uniref:hypothetical protein n=1 Tax=Mesorhizobium sp. M1B.F.Ca.ET.045.04.1.1 TaxID=2493673 RepID=UPI000F75931C|nr:hypothetical protein [Mesorhizobium sp. M1B.F.Ca.ET.045.04.1.1]AZO30000.1 hypothetical protein EJ071_23130 [Mesorhizobium sp. M1B.F.Ca.ET.045.04.1.1]
MDMEASACGASVESISAKMGNSIDGNKALQRTYTPVNLVAVRAASEHRRKGRKLLSQEHKEYKSRNSAEEKMETEGDERP